MQGVPLLKMTKGVGGVRARVWVARGHLPCRPSSDTGLWRSEWLYQENMISPDTCHRLFTCRQKCMLHYVVRRHIIQAQTQGYIFPSFIGKGQKFSKQNCQKRNRIFYSGFSAVPRGVVSRGEVAYGSRAHGLCGITSPAGKPEGGSTQQPLQE